MAYVAKGTPPGYDVQSAADYLLSFNGSWPLLKLHETSTFTSNVSHSLGYTPLYMVATSDGRIDQFAGLSTNTGISTSSLLYGSLSGTRRYFLYRLDITTNYTAPIIADSTARVSENQNYVFKMTKPGKDITSTDMRDFALHSNTRSPMVHKVVEQAMTVGPDGWNTTINHGLSYTPTVFVFIKPNINVGGYSTDRYMLLSPPVGSQDAYYEVNSSFISTVAFGDIFNGGVPRVAAVILKDPFTKELVNTSFP